MNLSKNLLALFIILSVLLFGSLLWRNSPEAFLRHHSDLPKEEKVISSSLLGFPSQTVEEDDGTPSFLPGLISIEQAIQSVIQRYPGRVTRAELLMSERGTVYEIDVERSDGTITVFEVDAQTGLVLGPFSDFLRDNSSSLSLSHENEI